MTQLLLTRPRQQAGAWLQRLQALGVVAHSLPLIEIAPAESPEPARAAAREIAAGRVALAVFVSPNAVEQFFAQAPLAWPAGTLAACVGPGSAQALAEAGVPPDLIVQPAADAASLDSEHLWDRLKHRDWAGRRVLFLRGDGGREWLAEQLQAAGAATAAFGVYRRGCPHWTAAEQGLLAAAEAAPADWVWLFSSAEALGHLRALAPQADFSRQRAVCTHPRIAEAAQACGFGLVVLSRPDATAVAQAAKDLRSL